MRYRTERYGSATTEPNGTVSNRTVRSRTERYGLEPNGTVSNRTVRYGNNRTERYGLEHGCWHVNCYCKNHAKISALARRGMRIIRVTIRTWHSHNILERPFFLRTKKKPFQKIGTTVFYSASIILKSPSVSIIKSKK